ncbi:hypothetical protein G7046_g6066 [Stylonectria norvegica]|nr:hypothetical protein G7046_g6066 [Stylonectria norvegica]
MSDADVGSPIESGKALPWTEEAKVTDHSTTCISFPMLTSHLCQYQFLLRIVAQYKEDGKPINWSNLNMPGRTTKSLQNMWTKVNKSIEDIQKGGDGALGTPKKPAAPRKRAKKADVEAEDSDGNAVKKATPRKRAKAATGAKSSKKIKKDDSDDEMADVKADVDDGEEA